MRRFAVVFSLCLLPTLCRGTVQSITNTGSPMPAGAATLIQNGDATIRTVDDARALIDLYAATHATEAGINTINTGSSGFYCIIHVVRWADQAKGKVDQQHWYVYRGGSGWSLEDFQAARLYGIKGFYLLYIQTKVSDMTTQVQYTSTVTTKVRANLTNLFGIVSLFTGTRKALDAGNNSKDSRWGGGSFQAAIPSDISITAMQLPADLSAAGTTIADGQKFDDEGKYYVDFSIGVPIQKVSDVTFNSTTSTVTPPASTTVSNRKLLALVDLHVPSVDVKSTKFNLIPYAVSGVAISQQPLRQILLGVGWGPQFANFYIGSLWVKQLNPPVAGQPSSRNYNPQLAFGLNITLSSFTNLSKK